MNVFYDDFYYTVVCIGGVFDGNPTFSGRGSDFFIRVLAAMSQTKIFNKLLCCTIL